VPLSRERRTYNRVRANAIIRIFDKEDIYYSISGDISLGGVNIVCRLPYRKNDVFDIDFTIRESHLEKPVRCKVKVIRVSVKNSVHHLHCLIEKIAPEDFKRFEEALNDVIVEAWFSDMNTKKIKAPKWIDKRKYHRVPMKIWIVSKEIDEHIHLPAENISSGGIYVITPAKHEPGSILEIAFKLPGNEHVIESVVLVMNIRPEGDMFGIGLRFLDMEDDDKKALHNVITSDITAKWFVNDTVKNDL
jgi:hypothetical protein